MTSRRPSQAGEHPGPSAAQDELTLAGMDPQTWQVFTAGYEAGITHGITIGRAQVEAEDRQVWAEFGQRVRSLGRQPGPIDHHEHETWLQEREPPAAGHPSRTGEELIEAARRSWALSRAPRLTAFDDRSTAAPPGTRRT